MLRTDDLDYDLPQDRIATVAAEPRDAARLMVLPRDGEACELATMADLPRFLRAGDLLVFNATRVMPARLLGKKPSGGKVEGLYLSPGPREGPARTWIAMLGASHLHVGTEVELFEPGGEPSGVRLRLLRRDVTESTAWVVEVVGGEQAESDLTILERCGLTPLPPYIRKAREKQGIAVADEMDRERYQTVYAHADETRIGSCGGSVAAPTAGLHFTERLLARLDAQGVGRAEVTLHVGTGTFKSVETEFVEQHPMHEEWCTMSAEAVGMVLETRKRGGRVIAVGTTAARTLESYAAVVGDGAGAVPGSISTRILITPGYGWRWVDGMVTNFHLPRSTLMAMVASRLDGEGGDGLKRLKDAYVRALTEGFRFYSYGDGMLIVP
ncbi:MAG: tRNA preQ1(34) S-adenosylmethionine ribosyltransferase-isomerase QueA [Planctomycetes bacterium]|nr:tRNA preQ1(34) S-adenosylmethionine ribosyltransferase-isomerase QueA [Planctomycetota bacterium]